MDSSRLLAPIAAALDCLHSRREQSFSDCDKIKFESMMIELKLVRTFLLCSTILANAVPNSQTHKRVFGLRFVRTLLLCSKTLANNVHLRTEGNHNSAVPNPRTEIKKTRMRNELIRSLLVRVEDVVRRILVDHIPYEAAGGFRYDMECLEEEIDKWYTCLSEYLEQASPVAVGSQIKAIADSVLENLKDYLSFKRAAHHQSYEELLKMEALEKNITFVRDFICFGTLFSAENQEFQYLLTQIQPLAISAAHLVYLFSNKKGASHEPNDLTSSMISALLLKINHVNNPLLLERYTLALTSLKHSQRLYLPNLDLNDDPLMIIMEDFVASLLSTLWEMLQLVNHHMMASLKGKMTLHEGLMFLRTLLKKHPNKFVDDRARDILAAAICDAGVIIFSLYQKDFVIEHGFQGFQYNIEVIRAEVLGEQVVKTPRFKYSETNVLGFLDFLLEDYLTDVKNSSSPSFISKICEYLGFLKLFMGKLVELRNLKKSLHQDLWNISIEVAYKIEFLIDQLVLGDFLDSFSMSLQSITEDVMTIKADSLQIMNDEGRQEIFKVQQITWPSADKVPSTSSSPVADELVGFESEKASIVNRLMSGFKKLQVVAVVGMPGLGKTTLATKVYSTPSISHCFHVKACCSISQVFDRRKVLLELLNQIQPGKSDSTMNEDDLSQQLWRSLKRRRYLIFIDDIWDTKAFDLLIESLPNDSNQSRILLTSRHGDVVPESLLDGKPIFLPHLTVDESLELLQKKLFPAQKNWPSALHEFGMEIGKYCKGLPLTIVIIAGLLKTTEQENWNDVVKTLRSSIVSDVTDQCESTIELSYNHLPDHLKPCFLWFGAFPEDHEFSVKKLIWLWIAEGLVRKSEFKSLEDVAADYLKILIGRSLVISVKERTSGGVKACRIHDLLHDFCLRKAKEDYFLHLVKVKGNGEHIASFDEPKPPCGEPDNPRRFCMYAEPRHIWNYKLFFPRLRSLLFLTPIYRNSDLAFIFRIFKLLRVLDVEQVYLKEWSSEVGLLIQLRYLAIRVSGNICPALGKLSKLETLILCGARGDVVSLPDTLWNLRKLRHLYSKHGSIELPINDSDSSCNLLELQTLSTLRVRDLSLMEKHLRKFPNIRQMKIKLQVDFLKYCSVNDSKVIDFSFLSQLQSLFFYNTYHYAVLFELIYPENIKKLTLRLNLFPWNKIASIAKLPHLEVLKLLWSSFLGDTWHIEEGEFPKLKFLKLETLSLVNWTAARNDLLPNLEKLVLRDCKLLKEIPECLENVATLEMIEVINCSDDVVSLAKKVEEFQKDMGNSFIQFHERRTWQERKSGTEDELYS